ncbi:hypothetical protein RM572_21725 [Streptomyces sp. DSM 42041]|uniref:Uncharacterized protein n=1 Tax=Streptomyces hazeniae TaxID=3075538 RepID=A0ABU2NXN6_9ACTN|nr:hypothetical protein [Streptomyces sp. DSM 42041]MDT0381381.1 hypothetical protein [Streptomyces sp. DSM 42041]
MHNTARASATEPPTELDETQASAARMVAEHAADAEDCRYLLDALGLLPEGVEPADAMRGAA